MPGAPQFPEETARDVGPTTDGKYPSPMTFASRTHARRQNPQALLWFALDERWSYCLHAAFERLLLRKLETGSSAGGSNPFLCDQLFRLNCGDGVSVSQFLNGRQSAKFLKSKDEATQGLQV
jgi:hypothetical protein